MKRSFRERLHALRACEQVCVRHRRTIESKRGGRSMFARLRRSIKTVQELFTRHLAAVRRASELAAERLQEYRDVRTICRQIAQVARIAKRDGKIPYAPDSIPRVSTLDVVSQAKAVLNLVSPYADILEDYGISAEVLHDMPRRLAALDRIKVDRFHATSTHMLANDAIRRALREGSDAIVGLEASLSATPGTGPKIVAELREAKRAGRSAAPRKRGATGRQSRAR